MSQSYDPDTIERIRSSRQVLAGDQVTPLSDPWAHPTGPLGLTSLQRNYALLLLSLLIVGVILMVTIGTGIATIPLFLLGLGLLAGWLFF
jgi:hypothetical protein